MKNAVNKADQWNADLYDSNHSFVSQYGNSLLELLNPKPNEKILDLGCGTGDLANKLFEKHIKVIGVDKSKNMIYQASRKYPSIPFIVKDATTLEYQDEFNAVLSNATLHWIKQPNSALECIYASLKNGGRFIAEFGGKGNIQMISNAIIEEIKNLGLEFKEKNFPWYYPSIGEYTSLMEKTGFRVSFAQHYHRPTPLIGENGLKNWIIMFGNDFFADIDRSAKEQIITNVVYRLKNHLYQKNEDIWIADYKRIRVIGFKE
ncbi:trans-aconitate 2-methyltransferase [Niallia sp. NCCP-28]|uniref:class I SAM-dependent methyltransferase n=1 Tax=Niallia sp. NCCP-28 TaxID=2934712 RepID=UPI0020825B00|nr:SAM-dependent methyltransferase [Niallia sp. NCCP-28]